MPMNLKQSTARVMMVGATSALLGVTGLASIARANNPDLDMLLALYYIGVTDSVCELNIEKPIFNKMIADSEQLRQKLGISPDKAEEMVGKLTEVIVADKANVCKPDGEMIKAVQQAVESYRKN
jgi:hypothetical protein